jgi:hypothetical protein
VSNYKFSKDVFPWYTGEFDDTIEWIDGGISLSLGKTIGTYTTVVYKGVGNKALISWDSEEITGEINVVGGVSPKTIEIRASDIPPTNSTIIYTDIDLVPDLVSNMVHTVNGWSASVSQLVPSDNIGINSVVKIGIGYPRMFSCTETGYVNGGVWAIQQGLSVNKEYSDTMSINTYVRIATGIAINNSVTDAGYANGGIWTVQGSNIT